MKPTGFIVVYDDEDCVHAPYGWCNKCPGAIESAGLDEPVALFRTRADAKKAITISVRWARLCEAKGEQVNVDFTEEIKNVKIRPLCLEGGK